MSTQKAARGSRKRVRAWRDAIAAIIEKHLSYVNGWAVSEETFERECQKAAKEIVELLDRKARP